MLTPKEQAEVSAAERRHLERLNQIDPAAVQRRRDNFRSYLDAQFPVTDAQWALARDAFVLRMQLNERLSAAGVPLSVQATPNAPNPVSSESRAYGLFCSHVASLARVGLRWDVPF